eukprot:TRINITY_DN389_c0_g1_i2.p1 TRINITY_DN389_c0_g1~~TRINITY_DN389_c0_g1_i2.p1  ORF type:complete len:209 (+),score=36.28 TRINITY_DN389_c0_g1_i2:527-1153(+)
MAQALPHSTIYSRYLVSAPDHPLESCRQQARISKTSDLDQLVLSDRDLKLYFPKYISSNILSRQQLHDWLVDTYSRVSCPAIFEFEEDALVDKPVEKFLLDDDDEESQEEEKVDFIDDDNIEAEDEVLSQLATSVPVDIPLKSMAKTWHDRYLDSDDEDGPRQRSKTIQFEKPHELAAKTYQDVYLRNGIELDVPMSVSTKKRIKAYI